MRRREARAWMLAAAAVVSCGKGAGGSGSAGGGMDAGVHGPTDLTVSWTLAGQPADAAGCTAHGATEIYVNLSGTINPSLHQTATVPCAMGSQTFPKLLVEKLGMPYLEGTLLDAKGVTVAITGTDVTPTLGTTTVTIDFFSASGTGGASASSAAASSSHAAASSSSGTGSASSSSGTGGASSTSSSANAASSSSGTTSASSSSGGATSTSSSSGIVDAGSD